MSLQSNVLRTPGEETLKAILFFQVGVGARATVTLFFRNFSPVSHGRRQRPSHTILTHMAVASLLVFLSTGIPYKLVAVVLQKLLSSLACKFVYQTHILTWVNTPQGGRTLRFTDADKKPGRCRGVFCLTLLLHFTPIFLMCSRMTQKITVAQWFDLPLYLVGFLYMVDPL
uniref:Vomeronasal type-1 receptor n=1 Tax=Neovison vison TaxID=452646 RepID=A0A8C7AYU5_NEOVI